MEHLFPDKQELSTRKEAQVQIRVQNIKELQEWVENKIKALETLKEVKTTTTQPSLNEPIVDESKQIKVNKLQHKMNYPEEIKLYINYWKKDYPKKFSIKDLAEFSKEQNKPISYGTWWRRLWDEIFLLELLKFINPKIKLAEERGKKKDIEFYEQIKIDLSIRITQVTKNLKKDILDTSKIDRRKNVEEIEDKSQSYENLDNREASSSYITPSYKLILN